MTFNEEHAIETYKSLISISVKALQLLLLLNGGAVVALLSYIGHAANGPHVATHATLSLSSFIAGVILSALGFFGSYFTQLALYNEDVRPSESKISSDLWLRVAFVFSALSLVAFAVGAYAGVAAMS